MAELHAAAMAMSAVVAEFEAVRFIGIKEGNPRPVELKRGGWSIETVRHHWCLCDECGVGTWINEGDLKAPWSCPECHRSATRKGVGKTPVCKGRTVNGRKIAHDPVEMVSKDPIPGRKCRMTPRCSGKHRKVSNANET